MDRTALYGEVLDSLSFGIYFVDENMRVQLWNKSVQEMTGFRIEELQEQSCIGSLLCHIGKSSEPLCSSGCPVKATIEDGIVREIDAFIKSRTDERVPVKVETKPIYEGDHIIGSTVILNKSETVEEDINSIIDSLTKQAMTDKLTGLYNRGYFEREVSIMLSQMEGKGNQYCVLFLDLDDFNRFNSIYGHEAGDVILKELAYAVTSNVRKTDSFCRWGGEEFAGIFKINTSDYLSGLAVTSLGNKILKSIRNVRTQHNGGELGVTASMGLTLARTTDTLDGIVKRASDLMYKSKTSGKNKYTIG